jgi:hypothetical protein
MRERLRWWNIKCGRGDWCCPMCMYDVYIFFPYFFLEFLETGKNNVIAPILQGTVPSVTNHILHLPE